MKRIEEEYPDRLFGARVISVIQSSATRGNGSEENPIRIVTIYHDLEGVLLAVYDPVDDERR